MQRLGFCAIPGVTVTQIATDFQVKPSDCGEITIVNHLGNQTNDLLLQGSKKRAKTSGVEKPFRRLAGTERCIMHVCETKRALEFLQSSFLPLCRETRLVGRPTIFSLLARKLTMPFQPKAPKKTGLTAPHLLRRQAFLHHFPNSTFARVVISFRTSLLAQSQAFLLNVGLSDSRSRLQIAASRWNLRL